GGEVLREVALVGQEDLALHGVLQRRPGGAEHRLEVLQDLARLRRDVVADQDAGRRVERDLTGAVDRLPDAERLRVRPDRTGPLGRRNASTSGHAVPPGEGWDRSAALRSASRARSRSGTPGGRSEERSPPSATASRTRRDATCACRALGDRKTVSTSGAISRF